MSVAEFLDGLPSYNKNNFSHFKLKKRLIAKVFPMYLSTNGGPPGQRIVTDTKHILIRYINSQQEKKLELYKRVFENAEESVIPPKRSKMSSSKSSLELQDKDTDNENDVFFSLSSESD